MHKVSKILVIAFALFASASLSAQNKYAVIIGIDEYYDAPGVKSGHSLKGCVNDALAIKEFLINRFGFDKNNIYGLYNALATKRNVLEVMHNVLLKCKAGDAVVIYYSGHGVWMTNMNNRFDEIKKGMSQAMVMSDLYTDNWGCLLRDETLKGVINKFIDRKVVVTSIIDCCYSANLAMLDRHDLYWDSEDRNGTPKDFDIRYLPYFTQLTEPKPCKGDSTDWVDSDGDLVQDCKDWQPNTPAGSDVDERGVVIPDPLKFYEMNDPVYDSLGFGAARADSVKEGEKAFDLKAALTANDKSVQPRPTERAGSRFLSLAGTTTSEKGLEITDVSGLKHGAFTVALLRAFENANTDMPVSLLMEKVNNLMNEEQYRQGPTFYFEGDRGKNNLIGIPGKDLRNRILVKCIAGNKGIVSLDKGLIAGLQVGNILTLKNSTAKIQVQVYKVSKDTAWCRDKTGKIKAGDSLELTDSYTLSSPKVKVFIPSANFTPAAYELFIKNSILPLTMKPGFLDYDFSYGASVKNLVFYKDAKRSVQTNPMTFEQSDKFAVFLPPPSYITDGLKALLKKDQNVELVNDTMKADVVLLINYSPKAREDKPGLIFSFNSPEIFYDGYPKNIFQFFTRSTTTIDLKGAPLAAFQKELQAMLRSYMRKNSKAWFNLYPRK